MNHLSFFDINGYIIPKIALPKVKGPEKINVFIANNKDIKM